MICRIFFPVWNPVFRCDCLLRRHLFQDKIFLVIHYSFINSTSIYRILTLYKALYCLGCRDTPDIDLAHEECISELRKAWHSSSLWCTLPEVRSEWAQCFKQRENPRLEVNKASFTTDVVWELSHPLFIFVAIQTPPKQPKNPTCEQWRDKLWNPPNGILYNRYTAYGIWSNVEKNLHSNVKWKRKYKCLYVVCSPWLSTTKKKTMREKVKGRNYT